MEKFDETPSTFIKSQYPYLSNEKCERIHEASLEILERIGARLFLDDAVDLLKKAGADVREGNLVCLKPALVEKALKTVPKKIVLHDRFGNPSIPLKRNRSFYGPGSDCLNIIDHRTGQRRKPLLKDLIEGIVLCDALPNIDFVMAMVVPTDVTATRVDRHQMEAMLTYASKPIIFVSYGSEGCRDAVEMAEVVAGSSAALRKKPFITCYINVISGLRHNKEALEKLMFMAKKNLPSLYIPASTAGLNSPVTPAGAAALDYAGILLGLVISQLVREGAPIIVSGLPQGTFDMQTLVTSYCEPERILPQAMAHFYELPMFAIGGVSEAKLEDQQAAAEAAMSLVVETFNGSDIIHDLGYLESGLTFSFVQLAMCDEIVSWIKAFTKEIEVSDETLALDLIAEIGPDGEYLSTDHTLRHYKERWYPALFERAKYEVWSEKGGKSFSERAQEKINVLLTEHRSEPLPDKVRDRVRKITLNFSSV